VSEDASGPPDGEHWRPCAKALVLDPQERVLLLSMTDARHGAWWELPGGGVEAGESRADAVARELAEECGVVVPARCVGPAAWSRRSTFVWGGRRVWSDETVHVVRLPGRARRTALARSDDERECIVWVGWHPLPSLSRLRTYPGRLAELAPALLAGRRVDGEPLERWS